MYLTQFKYQNLFRLNLNKELNTVYKLMLQRKFDLIYRSFFFKFHKEKYSTKKIYRISFFYEYQCQCLSFYNF